MKRYGLRFGLLGPAVVFEAGTDDGSSESSAGRSPGDDAPSVSDRAVRTIRSPKVRALLATLLLEGGRVVSVESLTDVLWGGAPPPSARASLHNHVARLRRLLDDPERLRATPPGYVLRVDEGELDVDVFVAGVAAARVAHAGRDWERTLRESTAALALWRGTPLAGLPAEVGGYALVQRLAEARLLLLEWRYDAELSVAGPRVDALVPELAALAAEHPLRESFHRHLMLALHRTGRRAEALAVHRDLRMRLIEELGVEPGVGVREAHVEVLRAGSEGGRAGLVRGGSERGGGDLARGAVGSAVAQVGDVPGSAANPDATRDDDTTRRPGQGDALPEGDTPAGPPRPPRPAQLPPPPAHFTGRTAVLTDLRRTLAPTTAPTPTITVAVLSGMPGVGKSALALQAAHGLANRFPDGQLYVNLHGATPGMPPLTPGQALTALLRDLGADPRSIPEHPDEAAALLRSLLAPTRTLMLLDDAANAAQVRPLLPAGPGCAVIVTSRSPLTALDGVRRFPLTPLTAEESAALLRAASGRDGFHGGDGGFRKANDSRDARTEQDRPVGRGTFDTGDQTDAVEAQASAGERRASAGDAPASGSGGGEPGAPGPAPTGNGPAPTGCGRALGGAARPLVGDDPAPADDGRTPGRDAQALTDNGPTLASCGRALGGAAQAPVGDGPGPTDDGCPPAIEAQALTGDGTALTGDGNAPFGNGPAPAPATYARTSGGKAAAPTTEGPAPTTEAPAPPTHPLIALTGGLPLALRVVAARLAARSALTPDMLAGQLAAAESRLHHLEYDDLSVRRSLAVAHDALAASEREVDRDAALALRRIGALDLPAYGAPLLARLTGTDERRAEAALDRLVDVALLEETAYGRYAPHDLVRDFARELAGAGADAEGEADVTETALRWYAAVAERTLTAIVEPGLDQDDRRRPTPAQPPEHTTTVATVPAFPSPEAAFAWGDSELENIVALVEQYGDDGTNPRTATATTSTTTTGPLSTLIRLLFPYLQRSGHVAEMELMGRTALRLATRLGDEAAEAYALGDLAGLHFLTGRHTEALHLNDRALTIWRRLDVVSWMRRCLNNRGLLLEGLGRYDESGEALRQSLEYSRQLNDPHGEAVTYSHLGNLYEHTDPRAAIEHHRRSLAIGDEIGNVIVQHSARCNIGYAHLTLGEPAAAAAHFEESLRILGGHGDWHGESQTRLGLVRALRLLGHTDRATHACAELLTRADARADRYMGGLARHQYGLLLRELSRVQAAHAEWRTALDLLDGTDEKAVVEELRLLLDHTR
ncbi:BTAD domain-containing putative transcriptional regulator [Streptomyces sp. NPDC056462]|uniref:BTAD domain-containing putative transcriptional regulator n=1 Tax=Streptomyces sp. NPDC056462 TaxID=3345826 RepID=UPI0036CF7592